MRKDETVKIRTIVSKALNSVKQRRNITQNRFVLSFWNVFKSQ